MPKSQVDVLIVGAGPVGLTLAAACRKHGISFRIVDKAPAASDKSKALAVWSGTLEILAALGLAETFVTHAMPFQGLHLADKGKDVGYVHTDEGVESRYAWPVILPQSRTEALLGAHLRSQGVAIEREIELIGLVPSEKGVTCHLRHAGGVEEEVRASYLVGCDGARSIVRQQLPVKFEGDTLESNFILVDARIEGGGPERCEVYVNWNENAPVALFPIEPGLWRLFSSRATMENREPPTLDEMQRALDNAGLSRWKLRDPVWLSWFQVNERVSSRFRVGRVFLCGDAAHIHSPAGGQGMNTGMQDGYNLAWKLKLLLEGVAAPDDVADSYHAERHAVAKGVVEASGMLIRGALIKNPILSKFRRIAASMLTQLPAIQRFAACKLSELEINYQGSPLVADKGAWPKAGGGIVPGTHARDVFVQTTAGEAASLWEQTFASDYTLLFFSGRHPGPSVEKTAASLAAAASALRPRLNLIGLWHGYTPPVGVGGIKWFRDIDARAHERYGVAQEAAWYLVRPDQYVAARAQPADIAALQRALKPVAAVK
jgi:2-polyprenyl-6-methoxyphenol hydroxylase-like FAD-dependent oxidoreductase